MKPIAIFVLVALVSVVAASARTGTAPGNADERVISQVAGPPAAAETSRKNLAAGKTDPKKAKSKPKPPPHDHN